MELPDTGAGERGRRAVSDDRGSASAPADPARRAVRYARIPGKTVAEACTRYGVSRAAYDRARRAMGSEGWGPDELLLVALVHAGGALGFEQLAPTLDWLDHAVYSPDELGAWVDRLEAAGLVRRDGERVELRADWP